MKINLVDIVPYTTFRSYNKNKHSLLGVFIPNNLTKLGCQFLGLCLLQLTDAGCGFRAHDATSPVTTDLEKKLG